MKTLIILTAVAFASLTASTAFAADIGTAQLLSLQYVTEGTTTVVLPTVRNPDGSICQSYIAGVSHNTKDRTDTTVKQICGGANASNLAPSNLTSISNLSSDGLSVQAPNVSIAR